MSGVFFCDKCSNLYDIGQDKNGNDIFICNSCGDSKKIESGTLFLSKGESINDNVNVNKNDPSVDLNNVDLSTLKTLSE